ncbi:hypothetical protein CPB85DRAFT_1290945, partial [Mucidula mucida]
LGDSSSRTDDLPQQEPSLDTSLDRSITSDPSSSGSDRVASIEPTVYHSTASAHYAEVNEASFHLEVPDADQGWDTSQYGFGRDSSFILTDEDVRPLLWNVLGKVGGASSDMKGFNASTLSNKSNEDLNKETRLQFEKLQPPPGKNLTCFKDITDIERPAIADYDASYRGSGSRYPRAVEASVPEALRFTDLFFVPSFLSLVVEEDPG